MKEAIESVQKYNSKLHNGKLRATQGAVAPSCVHKTYTDSLFMAGFSFKLGRRRVECGDLSDWRVH